MTQKASLIARIATGRSAHVKAGGGRGVAESSHSGQRIHRAQQQKTMQSVLPVTNEATGLTGTAARTRRAG